MQLRNCRTYNHTNLYRNALIISKQYFQVSLPSVSYAVWEEQDQKEGDYQNCVCVDTLYRHEPASKPHVFEGNYSTFITHPYVKHQPYTNIIFVFLLPLISKRRRLFKYYLQPKYYLHMN